MVKYYIYSVAVIIILATRCNAQPQEMKKKIEVGSMVPDFSLPDQDGEMFHIKDVLGKKKLVIYFYPKDDTPGCTKQACTFRDQYDVFDKQGAMIIGISGQSVESHKAFAEKYHLNFTLLADTENKVRSLFGVPTSMGVLPGRVTYIADLTGKVVYVFNSQTEATRHVEESLNILKNM
jgi:peroxiredoxin Q/BCP